MLKARQCVLEAQEYESQAGSPGTELRLDLNEKTSGCSPRVLAKLRRLDAKKLAQYTPREPGEKLVADFLGLKPSEVMLTNGADEAIDLLCRAYLDHGDEMLIAPPVFSMYEIFSQSAGAKIVRVPCGPDFRYPVEQVLGAISTRTRLIIITNPNNPTGTVTERADILRVAQAAPDAAVMIDEAYFNFYGRTLIDQVGKLPNLFVVRTFSKAYGLAGLRIGMLAGDTEQISAVRRLPSPFNLNVFALECLAEALADRQWVQSYVEQVCSTREWLRHELMVLGVRTWPSHTNFVLADFGPQCGAIIKSMTACGIALRARPDLPGCIRISIGTQPEMERMISALKPIIASQTAARVAP